MIIPEPILTTPALSAVAVGISVYLSSFPVSAFLVKNCPFLPVSGRITFSISSVLITVPSAAIE